MNIGKISKKCKKAKKIIINLQNYQQAIAIFIEFGDRYEQANIYHNLGLLAKAEGNLIEAGQNLLRALEIFAQFQEDRHSVEIALHNLSRIYQITQDASLLESISQVLGISIDQIRQQLESS